ncbi:hypothetical protein C0J52_08879 [Blattella germanica]|nr:hypothetical protein C0J52_08879 [Blattella germanica]
MPKSSSSFYTSNMSLASLDRAKDLVKGSLKALNIGTSMEHRMECEQPILESSSSDSSVNKKIIRDFCNTTVEARYGIQMGPSQLDILWSTIVSIFLVGGVTGSLSGGWVADRFGRRGSVIINNILGILAAILFVCSRYAGSVEMLLLARLVVGLSSGLVTSTIPMYLTEIAPISIRGAMGVLCPLGLTVGVLIAQILGLKNMLGMTQFEGWTPLLVLTGVAATAGSCIPVGYNIGVMNTPAHIIRDFCNTTVEARYGIQMGPSQLDILWSTIVSIFLVGGVTGSLSGGWVADRFGRRGSVIINNILGILAAVLFVCSRYAGSVEMLLLARLVVGLSSGLVTSTIPMYLTEIAPISIRGAMGVLCPLGLTVGVLIAQILGLKNMLGQEETWHYLLGLYALPILVSALVLPLLPESPKYLYIVRGQEERGIKARQTIQIARLNEAVWCGMLQFSELSRIRGVAPEELEEELEDLRAAHKAEQDLAVSGVNWTMGNVVRAPSLRLPLMLVCALQAGQQCSGINAVFYYSVSIFDNAGLSKQASQYASIGAGCVNLMIAIIAIPLVNRCGRRTLALSSCWCAATWLVVLCISINYIKSVSWMPYFCIFAVLSYVFCYGFGLGPIPYFIGSELFVVGPRPVAMSFGSMANWGGNFLVGMTFPTLQSMIGPYSFLPFALSTVLLAIFLKYYLPESKGRDPSDVAEVLKYGLRSQISTFPTSASHMNKLNRNSSVCSPDGVSISSHHQHISSDLKNPDSLVLDIPPPISPAEVTLMNSSAVTSPATIIHHNNSYTNLPAIPELPGKNSSSLTNPNAPDVASSMSTNPVLSVSHMPSIPENLTGASSRLKPVDFDSNDQGNHPNNNLS